MKNLIVLSIFCCIFSFACISPVLGAESDLDKQSTDLTQNYEKLMTTTDNILKKISYSYVSERDLKIVQKIVVTVDKLHLMLGKNETAVIEKLKELNSFYSTRIELKKVLNFFQDSNYFIQDVFTQEGWNSEKVKKILKITEKYV